MEEDGNNLFILLVSICILAIPVLVYIKFFGYDIDVIAVLITRSLLIIPVIPILSTVKNRKTSKRKSVIVISGLIVTFSVFFALVYIGFGLSMVLVEISSDVLAVLIMYYVFIAQILSTHNIISGTDDLDYY